MKIRFYLVLSATLLLVAGIFAGSDSGIVRLRFSSGGKALAQQPRRWRDGDTLWWEIDSLPMLPSDEQLLVDSLSAVYPRIEFSPLWIDSTGRYVLPEHITIDYRLPYWNVYRRSVMVWGINFSLGQINPYALFPEAARQDPTVLSFPLQPPRR